MGSTFYSLHYHVHKYLAGTIKGLGGVALKINGVEDHVHLLVGLKTTHCIADFTCEWKKASSVWSAENHERDFAWQDGYSVFSVSKSGLEDVSCYIERQEEHHRTLTFDEELKKFLDKHEIKYDPKYLV